MDESANGFINYLISFWMKTALRTQTMGRKSSRIGKSTYYGKKQCSARTISAVAMFSGMVYESTRSLLSPQTQETSLEEI